MNKPLKKFDIFQGLEVTKVDDNFCFFDKKKLSWEEIQVLIDAGEKILYRVSPNIPVNWSNKEEVIKYHDCFQTWNTYMSVASSELPRYKTILKVKEGLVFYNNEYYLPCPVRGYIDNKWTDSAKQTSIIDGKYNVTLRKQENCLYPKKNADKDNITVNIFELSLKITSSIEDLEPNTNTLIASQYNDCITFGYQPDVWNGISFYMKSIDVVALFKKYYILSDYCGNDKRIDISDKEIENILLPIKDELTYIVEESLEHKRDIDIEIDNDYGDIWVSHQLRFKQDVTNKVFDLINNQIKNK